MPIQLGVPGAAGGGGGGGPSSEIQQAGGRVTVESDGSITIQPVAGQQIINMKGVLADSAPAFQFDDDAGDPQAYVGPHSGAAGAQLSQGSPGDLIIAVNNTGGAKLVIGANLNGAGTAALVITGGAGGTFQVAAPRTHFTDTGPYVFGAGSLTFNRQFEFAGDFTPGGSTPTKYLWEGILTTLSGAGEVFGHRIANSFVTAAVVEDIDLIALMSLASPSIVNNLTGSILAAVTLDIENAPSAGVSNFALRVQAGLTALSILQQPVAASGQVTMGDTLVSGFYQYRFTGTPTLGSSNPKKFLIDGRITGQAGAQNWAGFESATGFITQTATEQITAMYGSSFLPPSITDNLTGGATIENAATVRISNQPSGADNVWALLVQAGLTELQNLEHAGTLLGFFGTSGVAQPTGVAVTDAGIHAALVTLGLITA